jgi:hypothetical protein
MEIRHKGYLHRYSLLDCGERYSIMELVDYTFLHAYWLDQAHQKIEPPKCKKAPL